MKYAYITLKYLYILNSIQFQFFFFFKQLFKIYKSSKYYYNNSWYYWFSQTSSLLWGQLSQFQIGSITEFSSYTQTNFIPLFVTFVF